MRKIKLFHCRKSDDLRAQNRECLAETYNDSVYRAGDTYYFTIEFDCSQEAMKKFQPVLLSEYASNMGAPEKTLKMQNTAIDVSVRNIDGKMKFTAWYRSETYSGKAMKVMETTCSELVISK